MVYLSSFSMLTQEQEDWFFDVHNPNFKKKNFRTVYTTKYPFGLFYGRGFSEFLFTDITVFCGNNGSGKSTVLNVIAEKLGIERGTVYNRSDFFDDYVELCSYKLAGNTRDKLPRDSRIITSDDVFERVLELRRLNDGIDSRRNELIKEYITERDPD
ncbi:MAG: ATP-binding cassette domain-containing protein, partial [Eubacteriales bacterium]